VKIYRVEVVGRLEVGDRYSTVYADFSAELLNYTLVPRARSKALVRVALDPNRVFARLLNYHRLCWPLGVVQSARLTV